MTRDEAHRRAIEAGARALYERATLDTDAHSWETICGISKSQADHFRAEVETAITAYLAAMVLPIEEAPKASNKGLLILNSLKKIAHGRLDCGRPLGGEAARQIARMALIECGQDWTDVKENV